MARTYIISEICGDWALQIREPGHPHQFLYFNSKNNADLVKSILEWEDAHQNEAVPYKPALTPPNEPVTLEELRKMEGKPFYDCASREWYIVDFVSGSTLYTAEGVDFEFGKEETEGRFYRRPPEGENA